MPKIYIYPNTRYICAICLSIMEPDIEYNNKALIDPKRKSNEPVYIKFYCNNPKCSQYDKRVTIKPTEVEVEDQ